MLAKIVRCPKSSPSPRLWRLLPLFFGFLVQFMILLFTETAIAVQDADQPLSPEQAAATMVVPDGFHVTLFAGEPDVQQPIGFCIDDRGRLWVAEAYNYPDHGTKPGDRIVILEDSDGDGKFDKRKIFYDKLNYVTGIELGFGGAWVVSPPFFYFIPDQDGDDVPDEAPKVLLDGFGTHANSHNLANALAWGPDGWLYGTHGRTNFSRIAKPGTPDKERTQFDGGVYRYHPTKHLWEPFADGTTNPWGIDWNDVGEGFVCNCVTPHLFHVIQGAHYEPWRNRESSRYAYERLATIADHLHFIGQENVHDGIGSPAEDLVGGGHAHCGTMIYQGDNWPEKYRNHVFMNNIHGKRINFDLLKRNGSGYTASHGPDLLRSKDPWHMGVTLQYGPDGSVFMSDWSDTGECHSTRNTRRETGRIFKISFGQPTQRPVDLARSSTEELARLHSHKNEWFVRHARRILQERTASGNDMELAHAILLEQFEKSREIPQKLRAFWTLHAIEGIDNHFVYEQLSHRDEHIRGWAIRFLGEASDPSILAMARFAELAKSDPSSYVRLQLASLLQRLKPIERWKIASALLLHQEDLLDPNLPWMNWYAIEPLVDLDMPRFALLAEQTPFPMVRKHIARRIASHTQPDLGLNALASIFAKTDQSELAKSSQDNFPSDIRIDLLDGMLQGFEGKRSVPIPVGWSEAYRRLNSSSSSAVRQRATEVALVFNDPQALESLRLLASDATAPAIGRIRALRALIAKKATGVDGLLIQSLSDLALQRDALRGLAEFDHPETVSAIIGQYATLESDAKQDAIQTLCSRRAWASHLVDAIEAAKIPSKDITAFTARQLKSLNDPSLTDRFTKIWGEVRTTAADKEKIIANYKKQLTPNFLAKANLEAGRELFQKNCANCHRLFGKGGTIGPEITGAQRKNLDYMLENLVDPSAAVSKDFQMEVLVTDAGRVITGLIIDENEQVVIVQTANERLTVPTSEIEKRTPSRVSMMPDGLLQSLTIEQVRDLLGAIGKDEG